MARKLLTDLQIDEAIELREKGLTFDKIGERLGCSGKAVSWHCLKHGAEPPKPTHLPDVPIAAVIVKRGRFEVRKFTQAEDEQLLALEAAGTPPYRIGQILRRRHNSITGRLMTLARRDARQEAA